MSHSRVIARRRAVAVLVLLAAVAVVVVLTADHDKTFGDITLRERLAGPGPGPGPGQARAGRDVRRERDPVHALGLRRLVGQKMVVSFRGTRTPPRSLLRRVT